MPRGERRFFKNSIEDLERLVERSSTDGNVLRDVQDELGNRSTDRARRLTERVDQLLSASEPEAQEPAQKATRVPSSQAPPPKKRADLPITNTADSILSAWTALEVLSPPTFQRPERLAGDGFGSVARFSGDQLPWEGRGESSRKNYRLYYQVVLGSIAMTPAVERMLAQYQDRRDERPSVKGEAVLAVLMLDKLGRPVDSPFVSVSSFGWGLPIALSGDLSSLGEWQAHEALLIEKLEKLVLRSDREGNPMPVDQNVINKAYQWLIKELKLPADLVRPPSFAIRTYQYFKSFDPPESLLLNSFYLRDLAAARHSFKAGTATTVLKKYLGVETPARQLDLLHDDRALADAVQPSRFPPARWPSRGRHPLVLLQQAAVNLAVPVTASNGLLAVNGPPGTGKTTLLRDIVASQVTERAVAMAKFADPEKAFEFTGSRIKAGQGFVMLYNVDAKLRGHEILVASTNNKAVENVSAELPRLTAIAEDADGLRYFKTISDHLSEHETWGAIAAVLGNSANRSRFRERFWWDDDIGMSTYLANAAGNARMTEEVDENGEVLQRRRPKIVENEHPPRDHREALERWHVARSAFGATHKRSVSLIAEIDTYRRAIEELPAARNQLNATQSAMSNCSKLARHWTQRPGLLSRLFGTKAFKLWRKEADTQRSALEEVLGELKFDKVHIANLKAGGRTAVVELEDIAVKNFNQLRTNLTALEQVETRARDVLGAQIVDAALFARDHDTRHLTSPWLPAAVQKARDDLFESAMALHKAFVDAAAKPLRHNLNAFMTALSGRSLGTPEKDALVPQLWASLFLVVPVISTTFASVDRMLGRLPAQSLGWLLIDEAGQAAPQAAIGAIMRVRRTVVVGDPMQIEPVVMLPDSLTESICRHFGVDPDRFNAPTASVQTLADAATPYSAEFANRVGSRTVGVPLLVHRRCAEPMFGVSNAVAYEGLMVRGTPKRESRIRDVLGASRWIHIEGGDQERWCPEEGEKVLAALRQLRQAQVEPNLYVVTPFVAVQDALRRLIIESKILEDWVAMEPWQWAGERVGTVHTVQGREAEAVLFVLGAQSAHRTGARGWAGGRPNLLNVAVTRAQQVVYVIGNRTLWREAGVFRELDARLPI